MAKKKDESIPSRKDNHQPMEDLPLQLIRNGEKYQKSTKDFLKALLEDQKAETEIAESVGADLQLCNYLTQLSENRIEKAIETMKTCLVEEELEMERDKETLIHISVPLAIC